MRAAAPTQYLASKNCLAELRTLLEKPTPNYDVNVTPVPAAVPKRQLLLSLFDLKIVDKEAEGDEAEACALLDESLSHIKAARMVVGHTIQERGRMRLRCGGRLVLFDSRTVLHEVRPHGRRDDRFALTLWLGGEHYPEFRCLRPYVS